MKKTSLITILVLVFISVAGVMFFSPQDETIDKPSIFDGNDSNDSSQIEITVPEDTVVPLFAVGDNLIHDVIYKQASDRAGGDGYDFSYAYEKMEDMIPESGIVFVNQETPLATSLYPPSNYPLFNTPTEAGEYLTELGFNTITQVNNHMLDKWDDGLQATYDFWQTQNVDLIGLYENGAEIEAQIIEQNGIKIGMLALTDHTNGLISYGEGPSFILTSERDLIASLLADLKASSDVVIVSVHWGEENTFVPNDYVKDTAQFLADNGVDLILGHHSHTVQPVEYIEGSNGNETLVVYSLGNFISAMAGWENMLGAAFECNIVKDGVTGRVSIERAKLTPIVTYYNTRYANLEVMPLALYTEDMASQHGIISQRSYLTPEYLTNKFNEVISEEFR